MTRCGPSRNEFTMRQTNEAPGLRVLVPRHLPKEPAQYVINSRPLWYGPGQMYAPHREGVPKSICSAADGNTAASSSTGGQYHGVGHGGVWLPAPLLHTCTAVV